MENPEEDAGSLADASRLASARERNIGHREDNAMSECSADGASSPMPDLTTETLLHMIDELVDEPRSQQLSAIAVTTTAAVVSETFVTSSSSISSIVTSSKEKCDSNNEMTYQSNCEQPKQVPKLTIKLSGKQSVIPNSSHKFNEVYNKSSSSEISESDSSENDESASTSDQAPTTDKIITESVPKVTIKLGKPGTDCEGKFYTQQNVPKLTIKTHDLESEEESVSKIILKVSQQEEKSPEKIPKLTIKPINKPDNQQLSPKLSIKPIPKLENQQISPKLTIKPIPKPDNQLSPKLTIKPIKPPDNAYKGSHSDSYDTPHIPKIKISQDYISLRECNDSAQVPKITIKPVFKSECETNQKASKKVSSKCDDNEINQKTSKKVSSKCDDNEIHQKTSKKVSSKCDDNETNQKISKKVSSKCDDCETNQKTSKKVSSKCDDNEHIPVVTKINIKPIQKPVESNSSSSVYPNHSGEEKIHIVSKLNIKPIIKPKDDEANHAEAEIPKITKLNIKPIINPDNPSEQKNSDSWSSYDKNIPIITKLNIKPVVEPSYEETSKDSENQSSETGTSSDENNEQIPIVTKLNIKPVVKPSYIEPLTIRPVPLDESTVPVVTKLNIKPVLKPEDTPQVSPKKTGYRSPNYPDYIPLVTKLNIKPVISPNECENQLEETPKNPPLLMKIRTKPDNTSSSEIQLNKVVLSTEYELCNNAIEIPTTVNKNSPKDYSKANNEIQTDSITQIKCEVQMNVKKSKEVTNILEKDSRDLPHIMNDLNSIEKNLKAIPIDLPAADTDQTYTQSNDNAANSHETADNTVTVDNDHVKEKSQNCISSDVLETVNSHKSSGNGISDLKLDESSAIVESSENRDHCIESRNTEHTLDETFSENSDLCKTPVIDVQNDTISQSPISSIGNKKQPQKRRRKGAKLHTSPPKRLRSSRIASKMQQAESTKDLNEETSAPEVSPHEITRSKLCELLSSKPLSLIPTSDIENIHDNAKSPLQNSSNFDSTRRTDMNSYLANIEDKPPEMTAEIKKDENWSGTNAIELECNDASTASLDGLDLTPIILSHDEEILLNDSSACDYSANISNLDPVGLDDSKTTVENNSHKKEEILETPQPKKRGRPRKKPLPESEPIPETPMSPTPAIEERPQRTARLSRGTPTVRRTPRRRGRGRGGPNRSTSNYSQLSPQLDISIETTEKSPEGKVGTHLDIDPTSSTVKLPRMTEVLNKMPSALSSPLSRRRSGLDSESSPASSELETPSRPLRGKGSRGGRCGTSRGARRARGGGRGAIYMKETMGIYGRVCGPATTTIELLEEETCMMDDNATQAKPSLLIDDDSQSSVKSSTNDSSKGKKTRIEFCDSSKVWTAAHVKEYHWTDDKLFMIQEQVALFLGVRSFNHQYPQLKRRQIVGEELAYLQDKGIVTLGTTDGDLTAVDASEVLDIMLSDYPHKYEEFRSHQRQRQRMGLEDIRPDRIEMKMELKSVEPKVEPPKIDPEKLRLEMAAQARAAAAEYNAKLNMKRFKSCADLQNMQIQRRRPMPPPAPPPNVVPPCGLYPLALLPGQYQHTYLRYMPEHLRYFPINTALDAPPPPARQATTDTESEAEWCLRSSSDDDSDNEHSSSAKRIKLSSSKRSSLGGSGIKDESSESTSRTGSQSAWTEGVDTCRMCGLREEANRKYSHERFLACSQCHSKIHPSCLELGPDTIRKCRDYAWQCAECKTCYGCHLPADDDKMLFCDLCDRGFHIYCVGLDKVPSGRWHCVECALCKSCGARDAAGLPGSDSAAGSTPEWHHHSKRGAGGHKVYSHSLCTPCARKSKMGHRANANSKTFQVEEKSWDADKNAYRIGRYCPLCERSFIGPKGTMQLVICKLCDRQLHQECVKQTVSNLNVLDYTCADCRRGGITSRAAAVRLAPRTIATLFMAKRRFNKYAHRQYMRSRQKDKQELPAVTPAPETDPLETEEDATTDIDTEMQADVDTETPLDIDLDAPIEIDADPSTDIDSLSELDADNSRIIEADETPLDDIDETANAVKSLQMDFD